MRKIAVFAEGQTELVFVRALILNLIDCSKLSFECFELLRHSLSPQPYSYSSPNPEVHFMIIQVHGDEGVASSIKEREKGLIERGYDVIYGIRDMYSEAYRMRSPCVIDNNLTREFTGSLLAVIQHMNYPQKIKVFWAIMEIEAWFLGMYNIFSKIDPKLTLANINSSLGIDLIHIDPEKEFYKPAKQICDIFALCGKTYDKKLRDIENITSVMDVTDFNDAMKNNRCACFSDFYNEINSYS